LVKPKFFLLSKLIADHSSVCYNTIHFDFTLTLPSVVLR